MARDVTIFADASVEMDGPLIPGPALDEWVLGPGRAAVEAAGLGAELRDFSPRSFPSRRLQSEYLSWAFDEALRRLGAADDSIEIAIHQAKAVELVDSSYQRVRLDTGSWIDADMVVLAQGHLDVQNEPEPASFASAADEHGLTYIPPGFTADQDLSRVRSGRPVIVRGFGLAFIDAMILLTEGRGGKFRGKGDAMEYLPSGKEPVLWVGSRRGVPYRPKLGYDGVVADPQPRYLDDDSLAKITGGTLDYDRDFFPLLEWNLRFSHYAQLFSAHADRTYGSWSEVSRQLHRLLPVELGGEDSAHAAQDVDEFLVRVVPSAADRFDLKSLEDPLGGHTGNRAELESFLTEHISASVKRSADPGYSMDLAVFHTSLHVYFRVHELASAGRFTLADRRENIDRKLHGFFSFIASGPPPVRLEQLLALHRARVLRFVGSDMTVQISGDRFVANSAFVRGASAKIRAHALIDAYLADNAAARVDDELLQQLLHRGEITTEAPTGPSCRGKFLADVDGHPIQRDGTVHPRRFLLGPIVSNSGGDAPFARPGTNSLGFRRADAVAREILSLAAMTPEPNEEERLAQQLAAKVCTAKSVSRPGEREIHV